VDLFLTTEELQHFTGYKFPSKMIAQLKGYGIRFFVAADGYPRVPRASLTEPARKVKAMPNIDALRNGP